MEPRVMARARPAWPFHQIKIDYPGELTKCVNIQEHAFRGGFVHQDATEFSFPPLQVVEIHTKTIYPARRQSVIVQLGDTLVDVLRRLIVDAVLIVVYSR